MQAAQGQAAYLVERGVGATVGAPDDGGSFRLSVLTDDAERAREVLGLTEDAPTRGPDPDRADRRVPAEPHPGARSSVSP